MVEAESGHGLDAATELRMLVSPASWRPRAPWTSSPPSSCSHAAPEPLSPGRPAAATEARRGRGHRGAAAGRRRAGDRECDASAKPGVFLPDQARRILLAAARLGSSADWRRLVAPSLRRARRALGGPSRRRRRGSPRWPARRSGRPARRRRAPLPTVPGFSWGRRGNQLGPAADRGRDPGRARDGFQPRHVAVHRTLPLVMTAAVLTLRLDPAEALVATTVNAAAALGLSPGSRGALLPGLRADLVVWDVPSHAQVPDPGRGEPCRRRRARRRRGVGGNWSLRSCAGGQHALRATPAAGGRLLGERAGAIERRGWGSLPSCPSREELGQQWLAGRLVLADRHRDDDLRVQLATESAAFVGASCR